LRDALDRPSLPTKNHLAKEFDEPIRGYLRTLAGSLGYKGASGDLEDFKHFSAALKLTRMEIAKLSLR